MARRSEKFKITTNTMVDIVTEYLDELILEPEDDPKAVAFLKEKLERMKFLDEN